MINIKKNNNTFKILSLLILFNLFTGRYLENIVFFNVPLNFFILFYLLIKTKLYINIFTYKYSLINIFFFYLFISLIQLFISFYKYGIWALRDGLYFLNMFFFFIGYYYSVNSHSIQNFDKFLSLTSNVSLIYLFLVILNLDNIGPTIISPQGNNYSLINFHNLRNIFIWVAFYLLIDKEKSLFKNNIFPLLLIIICIVSFQSRTSYLTIIILSIYFFYLNKFLIKDFFRLIVFTLLITLILSLYEPSLNYNLSGRLTDNFSIEYFIKHISTLFVFSENYQSTEALTGPESSALQRYGWWAEVINKNSQTFLGIFFGQGFGVPLIEFKSSITGFAREPHNMFISVYGRQGLIGLILFSIIIFKPIADIHGYISSTNLDYNIKRIILSYYIFILVIAIGFIGDSILNYSSASLPYYVFIGYILGYKSKYVSK